MRVTRAPRSVAARRPHWPGPGSDSVLPPGRCKAQVTRTAGRRRRPAAHTSPGLGLAVPPCPDGAPRRGRPVAVRLGDRAGPADSRWLTPSANGRGSRRDLVTPQSKEPLAVLGGKRPTCKGHAPTYSLYTVSGRHPRVYNASLVTNRSKMQLASLPA